MVDIDKFICDFIRSRDVEECYYNTAIVKSFSIMTAIEWALKQQGIIYKDGQLQRIEGSEYWTIEDAKPGDVLVDRYGNIGIIMDFCKLTWHSYIYLGKNGMLYEPIVEGISGTHPTNEAQPATREQRDLLFQKMTEAGYEWDASKLELRKISQRMISAKAKEEGYSSIEDSVWPKEDVEEVLRETAENTEKVLDAFRKHPLVKAEYERGYKDGKKANNSKPEVDIDEMVEEFVSLTDQLVSSHTRSLMEDAYRKGIVDTLNKLNIKKG